MQNVSQFRSAGLEGIADCPCSRKSGGASGEESSCQCRRCNRCGFDPWVGEIPWRRKWQPIPVFLPGKSHGQRSLASYSLWGLRHNIATKWWHGFPNRGFSVAKIYILFLNASNSGKVPWIETPFIFISIYPSICLSTQSTLHCLLYSFLKSNFWMKKTSRRSDWGLTNHLRVFLHFSWAGANLLDFMHRPWPSFLI